MFDRYREIQERRAKGEQGFTLIELLIVIVVLAILAAVVIFGLSGVTSQSAQSACNADAKTVEVAVETYHANNGAYPANPGQLTTADPVTGYKYLRTFPSPNSHYTVTLDGATPGQVDVNGANYDTPSGTPNPCASVK